MSSNTQTGATPRAVQKHATRTDALNTGKLNLLGLFGPQEDLTALIRLPGGRIVRVRPGARLTGGTVAAIDANGLVLQKRGQTQRIAIPGD